MRETMRGWRGLACGTRRVGGTGERIELCKTRRALLQLTPVTPVFGLRTGFLPAISVNYSLGVSSTTTCSIWSLPLRPSILQFNP